MLALLAIACGENEPPVLNVPDAGDGWAPWPPLRGDAGFGLIWSVEGAPPTAVSCEEIDLDRVRLYLVHPVADFETWSAPDLIADCVHGEIVRPPADGLAPGRYRFAVELLHPDGDPFQHQPQGEAELLVGETTLLGAVNVTEATPVDGGL
ncbi:MAG: hypothetical protein JRF63_04555 [Deltaproteobacteria bacterium]|nr:hypothetical protein [Deltaproteobacteria bacterium]